MMQQNLAAGTLFDSCENTIITRIFSMNNDELPRATAQELKGYKELEKEVDRLKALLKTESGYAANLEAAESASAQLDNLLNSYDWFDYTFEENGKVGLMDITERVLIPPLYDSIDETYEYFDNYPFTPITNDGKCGLVKRYGAGEPITDIIYDFAGYEENTGNYSVTLYGKSGLIDHRGRMVVRCILDSIDESVANLTVIESNSRFGLLMNGRLLVEPIYESIDLQPDEFCRVTLDGMIGYLTKDGQFTEDEEEAEIGAFYGVS